MRDDNVTSIQKKVVRWGKNPLLPVLTIIANLFLFGMLFVVYITGQTMDSLSALILVMFVSGAVIFMQAYLLISSREEYWVKSEKK